MAGLLELARNGLRRGGPDPDYADGDDATWMGIDWRALTRRVEVRGAPVVVVDTGGDGPPLLFVHGLAGLWQNWLLNIPAFMSSHRVIAIDLPGFGQSPMPPEEISIKGYARIVEALCEKLGVESPAVVGNSMGGFIAAEVALAFPTRVTRLVLVSAAGLSIEDARRTPLLTVTRAWYELTARGLTKADFAVRRPRARRAALQGVVRYPEKLSPALAWELVQGAGKPGFIPGMRALLDYSFRDRLSKIEAPVLIAWGRNDMLVPVRDAQEYARLIGPNARYEIFDDTGHVPMIERPTRFNELVRGFLSERTPEPQPGPVARQAA